MPEFLVGKAFNEWLAAKATAIDMPEFATEDGVQWGKAHCYYSNTGGFVVDFSSVSGSNSGDPQETQQKMKEAAMSDSVKIPDVELGSKPSNDATASVKESIVRAELIRDPQKLSESDIADPKDKLV